MAVDAASLRRARPLEGAASRLRALPAGLVLAGLVAASAVVRTASAFAHATPRYFPDEYIYASLARSLAHGELAIRGAPAHFPALLEPLLAAPFWLPDNPALAYRLTQGLHAVAMSLAAVPVYLLAGRLRLSTGARLLCASTVLVLPSLLYSSYVTADAVAFTLALGAIAAGVTALERPTARAQVAFLCLAGLATFARVQYVVLPVAFLVAAVACSGGPRVAARRFRLTLVLVCVPAAALLAFAAPLLGYYDSVLGFDVAPAAAGRWAATDLMLLAYACGWVVIPAALAGLVASLARPRFGAERAFAALAAALGALLLLEAALNAANGSPRFQERYLIVLAPLVPLLFCLGMSRLPSRGTALGICCGALGLLLLAARAPLSGHVSGDSVQDSPFLQALTRPASAWGATGMAIAVGAAATALALLAAALVARPRAGTTVGLVAAVVVLAATSLGATRYDHEHSRLARDAFLPADTRWVDHAQVGDVDVLVTPGSLRAAVSEQLFWNGSLSRLLRMDGAAQVDDFGELPARIASDGTILAGGAPTERPLLVQEYAAVAELDGARLLARTQNTALWLPTGHARLSLLVTGRYFDGWLAARSTVVLWPRAHTARRGTLRVVLSLPAGLPAVTIDLRGHGIRRAVRVAPARPATLELPVTVTSPWRLDVQTRAPFAAPGARLVAVRATVPEFIERP